MEDGDRKILKVRDNDEYEEIVFPRQSKAAVHIHSQQLGQEEQNLCKLKPENSQYHKGR